MSNNRKLLGTFTVLPAGIMERLTVLPPPPELVEESVRPLLATLAQAHATCSADGSGCY